MQEIVVRLVLGIKQITVLFATLAIIHSDTR